VTAISYFGCSYAILLCFWSLLILLICHFYRKRFVLILYSITVNQIKLIIYTVYFIYSQNINHLFKNFNPESNAFPIAFPMPPWPNTEENREKACPTTPCNGPSGLILANNFSTFWAFADLLSSSIMDSLFLLSWSANTVSAYFRRWACTGVGSCS